MKIYLRDRNQQLCSEWHKKFKDQPDVLVSCGDIFSLPPDVKIDAIVSPANSFGFMDGGIDYFYSERFGWGLSEELREHLAEEYGGELLVGQAVVIPTGDDRIPHLISAPTMRVPMDVSGTVNAYLAFRAVLRVAKAMPFESVLCPGLATSVGRMPYRRCALQMFEAYRDTILNPPKHPSTLEEASQRHFRLLDLDLDFVGWRLKETGKSG